MSELWRNPTVKSEHASTGSAAMSALMFTYPVHQAADILFCRGTLVPVGKDQLPHLELARLIARRFNQRYCPERPLFPEPRALLSTAPLILGIDGQKMSKSRRNAIALSATEEETAALITRAKTDSRRDITYDPVQRPDVSNLVLLAALAQGREPEEVAAAVGARGSSGLKRLAAEALNERLRPIRSRRRELIRDRAYLRHILRSGNERAQAIGEATLAEVQHLMHTRY